MAVTDAPSGNSASRLRPKISEARACPVQPFPRHAPFLYHPRHCRGCAHPERGHQPL